MTKKLDRRKPVERRFNETLSRALALAKQGISPATVTSTLRKINLNLRVVWRLERLRDDP